MNAPKVSHFVGFNALGGGRIRFRTAGCGACAWHRDLQGEEAVVSLRSFATLLRERADEAERLADLIESLRRPAQT